MIYEFQMTESGKDATITLCGLDLLHDVLDPAHVADDRGHPDLGERRIMAILTTLMRNDHKVGKIVNSCELQNVYADFMRKVFEANISAGKVLPLSNVTLHRATRGGT